MRAPAGIYNKYPCRLSISLSQDMLSSITELAVKGNRSLSGEIRQALEEYVAREKGKAS